jgi:cell division protease FtsH
MMVGRWGMSDAVGRVSVLPGPNEEASPFAPPAISDETHKLVDDEVRRIVDECYAQAISLLREHRVQLDALADALIAHETLDEADAYAVAGIPSRAGVPDRVVQAQRTR